MRRPALAFFFIFASLFFSAHGNELVSFGNSAGFQYIIAVPVPEDKPEAAALFFQGKTFFEALASENRLPDAGISLALTTNDYSRLPEQLRPAVPEGSAEIISLLERTGGGAAILVLPEEEAGQTVVKCGVKGKTAPPELLSALVEQLEKAGISWRLEESRLDLYRIGWMPENHILKAYFDAGLPAVAVCTSADIFPALYEAIRSLSLRDSAAAFSSQNYTMLKIPKALQSVASRLIPSLFGGESRGVERRGGLPPVHLAGGQLVVLSERLMVSALVFFAFLFLLYTCVLFLSSPKTRKLQVKKFLKALPLAILFAAVNFLAMRLAGHLASWLVSLRFGKPDAWILIPRAAVLVKISFAFLLSALASGVKNRFQAGRDPVSLGHVASIAGLANIFVFSALEFSMSGYFILCYMLVFAGARTKGPFPQAVLTVLAAAVFSHLYAQILTGNTAAISALYSNEGNWNLLAAFFALPFQLMAIATIERTASRLKVPLALRLPSKRKIKARLSAVPIAALACLILSVAALFFTPAWSKKKPLPVLIRQSITEEGMNVEIDSPAALKNIGLPRRQSESADFLPPSSPRPNDFISMEFSSRDFLDRKVYELVISPAIKPRRIDVLISSETGIAVNISTIPFQIDEGGREALFVSSENPETPMYVSFITGTAGSLQTEISCWSTDNPFGFYIEDESIASSSLLFVKKEATLSGGVLQ